MNGQAKVQLILELKNRLKTGLSEAKQRVCSTVDEMKGKLGSLKGSWKSGLGSFDGLMGKVSSLKLGHSKAFQAMKSEVPGLGNAIGLLTNPYALATAAAVALGAAGLKAASWSNEWATNMAKVNVTAQLSHKELDALSQKLVTIGERNVTPLEEVPQAFNRIISAGLDVNTSLKVLEPTLRASKAGFADLETVAAAGVGVMASSGEDITRVYDILFATLNKGNAEFNDIAQYLPKIVPLAKGAGFALDETAGAWAFLTAQGQKAEQATTGIMNMVKAFSTKDIVKNLEASNIKVFDKGKIMPIVSIVEQLSGKMAKLSDKGKMNFLDSIGLRDMEAKGAILSMVQNVGKLKEVTSATANSAGALGQAYENAKTPLDEWKIVVNNLKGSVMKPIGDFLLRIASSVGKWVLSIVNYFKTLYRESALFRDILSGIGLAISVSFKAITMPIRLVVNLVKHLFSLFKNSKIGGWIEKMYLKIRPYIKWLTNILGQVASILYKFLTADFKGAWNGVKSFKITSIEEIKKSQIREQQDMAKEEKDPFSANEGSPTANANADGTKLNDTTDKITDRGQAPRSITINIDSFVKGGINTQNTSMQKMDARELEAFFRDMLLRTIANVQTSYQ